MELPSLPTVLRVLRALLDLAFRSVDCLSSFLVVELLDVSESSASIVSSPMMRAPNRVLCRRSVVTRPKDALPDACLASLLMSSRA